MLKTRLTKLQINSLCQALEEVLVRNKNILHDANKIATNDSPPDFDHDYKSIIEVLKTTAVADIETTYKDRKPKGKILIMLSYNEPLIMCIDPILSALVAGNEVHVRPSTASAPIFHIIWEPLYRSLPWLADRLYVVEPAHEHVIELIPTLQAVYFFGSQHVAKQIGLKCVEHLVEFWPETEAADFAIYSDTADMSADDFADYLFRESFSHSGQICQRLQGAFIHAEHYSAIEHAIRKKLSTLSPEDYNLPSDQQLKMREQYEAFVNQETSASYSRSDLANMPSLITGLSLGSHLYEGAFFIPTLWLASYSSTEELIASVAQRPVQFGCNIWTTDDTLVTGIAQKTRLTRITVNTDHIKIRNDEGWGGSQPTSFGGNTQWSHKFSNKYAVIQK